MKLGLAPTWVLITLAPGVFWGQKRAVGPPQVQSPATVEVLAFDTRGRFLGPPIVKLFEAFDRTNYAPRFREGVANGIPFGDYRIEAYLPAYSSETRYVRVYQQRVTVIVGLTVGYETPIIPLSLHGRVVGQLASEKTFVKLAGVFSTLSMESPVASDGGFDLIGLSWGTYLLLVVGEDGVLASRTLAIPYTGAPLEIEIGRDHAVAPH